VQAQNSTIINILLEAGAQPNTKDNESVGGNSPMHLATELNMRETVAQLMMLGGEPEIVNACGFSCLHIAAREGHVDLVRKFIAEQVNLDQRDEYGYSPSYWAHRHKHTEIVNMLPPPYKITKEEYYEHIVNQVWAQHPDIMKGGKKKKKKKGKKKK